MPTYKPPKVTLKSNSYDMSPKAQRRYNAGDSDKMPVYGDDLNEKGKPKFKTPVIVVPPPKTKTGKL